MNKYAIYFLSFYSLIGISHYLSAACLRDSSHEGIPVFNYYKGDKGGYVYITTSKGTGVPHRIGLLRVKGKYRSYLRQVTPGSVGVTTSSYFVPAWRTHIPVFSQSDITNDKKLKQIALPYLPGYKPDEIWFDGNTKHVC